MRYYIVPVDSNDVKTTDNVEIAKSWAADEDLIVIDTALNKQLTPEGLLTHEFIPEQTKKPETIDCNEEDV